MAPPQPLPIEQVIAQHGMQQIAQKGAPSGSL